MYEITFITKDEKDTGIKTEIEKAGGKIVNKEFLGRRKFVYPIKKEVAGYYTTIYFDMEPKTLPNLEKKLLLNQELLRYLLIKSEKKPQKLKAKTTKPQVVKAPAEKEKIVKEVKPIEMEKEKAKKTAKIKMKKVPTLRQDVGGAESRPKSVGKEIKPQPETIKKPKITEKEITEEERLKKLEEKLDELLKE